MPRQIRRGVTPRTKARLRQKARAEHREAVRERRRRNEAFARAVQAFAKPYQTALHAHLDGSAPYVRYQRDVRQLQRDAARLIRNAGSSPKARKLADDAIYAKIAASRTRYAPMMQRAFDHVVDGVKYWGELMMLIQNHGGGALKPGVAGSATFQAFNADEEPEVIEQPLAFLLEPPYDPELSAENLGRGGIGETRADAVAEDGLAEASATIAIAGMRLADVAVGDSVTLPSGVSRVSLTARIRGNGVALAVGILGVSTAMIDVFAEIIGLSSGRAWNFSNVTWALAPIGFFWVEHVDDVFFVTTNAVPVPDGGASVVARGGVMAAASGGGVLAVGKAYLSGSVQQLTVNLEY